VGDSRRGARPAGTGAFLAVFVLAQALFGWPVKDVERPGWGVLATLAFLVTVGIAFVGIRARRRTLSTVVPAYAAIVVVALWRQADGGSSSNFNVVFALPVLWLALHGTMRQLWIAIVSIGALMLGPLLLLDNASYPSSDWRRAVLYIAVGSLMGPLTRHISQDRARSLARSAAQEPTRTHLAGILEASIEHAVITTDASGSITVLNAGAERLLGWTAEQVVGRHLDAFLPERLDDRRPTDPAWSASAYESLTVPALRRHSEAQTWRTNPQTGGPVSVTVTASALREEPTTWPASSSWPPPSPTRARRWPPSPVSGRSTADCSATCPRPSSGRSTRR
jgi:PAS domain-containing protein